MGDCPVLNAEMTGSGQWTTDTLAVRVAVAPPSPVQAQAESAALVRRLRTR